MADISQPPIQELQRLVHEAFNHQVRLLSSVSLCMLLVVTWTNSAIKLARQNTARSWIQPTTGLLFCLALVILGIFSLVLLFYFRCYQVVRTIMAISAIFNTLVSSCLFTDFFLTNLGEPVDVITVIVVIWNAVVVQVVAVFSKGPLVVQQGALVLISACGAIVLIALIPVWAMWWILALLPMWDFVAVFCAFGPLAVVIRPKENRAQMSVKLGFFATGATGKRRDVSTGDAPSLKQEGKRLPTAQNTQSANPSNNARNKLQTFVRHGVRLGLGDFVFYSVLVGEASLFGNWNLTVSCALSVLFGMCLTVVWIACATSPVPALPIPLGLGFICIVLRDVMKEFSSRLQERQIFI